MTGIVTGPVPDDWAVCCGLLPCMEQQGRDLALTPVTKLTAASTVIIMPAAMQRKNSKNEFRKNGFSLILKSVNSDS
jgi:hypothetical protein